MAREFSGLKKLWGGDEGDRQQAIDIVAQFLIFMSNQHIEIDPCQPDIAISWQVFFGRFVVDGLKKNGDREQAKKGLLSLGETQAKILAAIPFISKGSLKEYVQFSTEEEEYHRAMLGFWLTGLCSPMEIL